jgi:hypothetical protein
MKNNLIFKIVAWFTGGYQLALGITGVFASKELAASVIYKAFGATVEMTPQVFYLVKFCSAYVVAFGVAMILLATNPVKYKSIMWVAITLFSIRIIERLIFTELLNSSFGIPLATELTTSGILVVIIALLLIFQPKNNK